MGAMTFRRFHFVATKINPQICTSRRSHSDFSYYHDYSISVPIVIKINHFFNFLGNFKNSGFFKCGLGDFKLLYILLVSRHHFM